VFLQKLFISMQLAITEQVNRVPVGAGRPVFPSVVLVSFQKMHPSVGLRQIILSLGVNIRQQELRLFGLIVGMIIGGGPIALMLLVRIVLVILSLVLTSFVQQQTSVLRVRAPQVGRH